MATSIYSDYNIELPKQQDGDIERNTDVYAVKNSIMNILTTKKGSRRMLPEFGCGIYYMLFDPIDIKTGNSIGNEIVNALRRWEPRCILNAVNIDVNYDANQYMISIDFSIVGKPSIIESVKLILQAL